MENFKKFYIDGQWVDPQSSTTLPFINPATEEKIGVIAMGGKKDVDLAVAAAKKAFEKKYSGITVNNEVIPWANLKQKLTNDIAGDAKLEAVNAVPTAALVTNERRFMVFFDIIFS